MFSLDLLDISLMFAVNSVFLLITSEIISPHYKKVNVIVSKRNLEIAGIFTSILFLLTFIFELIVPILLS